MRKSENKFSQLINSNIEAVEILKNSNILIDVIYMTDFYETLKSTEVYNKIPNLEFRDRKGTKKLIKKHEN